MKLRRRGVGGGNFVPMHWMMKRFFDESFVDPMEMWNEDGVLSPDINLFETDREFVVEAMVPGYEEKDVEISLDGHTLIIEGKEERTQEEKKKKYHYKEMRSGSFYREIALPHMADVDKAKADMTKGVLRVSIPKRKEGKKRRVLL